MADSSGSSYSVSSSTPVVVETPENSIIDSLSGYAASLAGQMYNWAQGVYAQTSAITDQAVGNFLQASQAMTGLAGNMINQYNNLFAPENAQLVQDANSYASTARMQADMGMAGATQAQAGNQAIKNSEQNLLSYGIDPSSGRYAALDKAAAVQNAANVAGAENAQRQQDIQTGQNLRAEAVQVGAQLPASISNAENTAIQANTGAVNAALSNANTGANLFSLPDKYLGTAMNVKLPPVGQKSSSSGSSQNHSSSPNPSSPSGGGGNGGGLGNLGGSGGSGYQMPANTAAMGIDGGGGGGGRGQPNAQTLNLGGGGGSSTDWSGALGSMSLNPDSGVSNALNGTDWGQWTNPGYGDIGAQTTDALQNMDGSNMFSQGMGDTFGGENYGSFGNLGNDSADFTGLGNLTYDPSQNQAQLPDGWNDPSPQMADPNSDVWGSGSDAFQNGSGTDYTNSGGGFPDYTDLSGGTNAPDEIDLSGGDTGYARGGPIPYSASPSGGRKVDDVPAQMPNGGPAKLNAGEFVVPQDIAAWKGQEFFHNLIAQSRAKRAKMQAMMPVGPKARPLGPQGGTHGHA